MNVIKSFNLPSHKNQFNAYGTFEEQKSMRFTDVCVHKHRFIVRAYNKVKYGVKKKFSTGNRDEHKRKHSSIDYQKVINRLRKQRCEINNILQKRSKQLKQCKAKKSEFKVRK